MDKRTISNFSQIKDALAIINEAQPGVCTTQEPGNPRCLTLISQSLTGDARIAVRTDCVGYESIDEKQVIPLLFAAIQELSAEVAQLKAKKPRKANQPSE